MQKCKDQFVNKVKQHKLRLWIQIWCTIREFPKNIMFSLKMMYHWRWSNSCYIAFPTYSIFTLNNIYKVKHLQYCTQNLTPTIEGWTVYYWCQLDLKPDLRILALKQKNDFGPYITLWYKK